MKKIKAILVMIVSILCLTTLASCGKKANIEVVNISAMRTKIGVTILVDDPKAYITQGSITAILYETDSDGDKVDEVYFDSLEEDEQTKTFKDLEEETTYKLVIKATVDDKTKTYYNKKVTTTNEGSTEENPILISTAEEFQEITYDSDAYYKLDKDIDFADEAGNNTTITPLFDNTTKFEGHFDGNGHTISNFTLDNSKTYNALFGYVALGASIKNLNVEGVKVSTTKGSNLYVSAFVGINQGTITNCNVKDVLIEQYGSSSSKVFVGGFAAVNAGIIADSSIDEATISSRTRHESFVGGFVGSNGGVIQPAVDYAKITNSTATNIDITAKFESNVTVDKDTSDYDYFFMYVGGFAGEARNDIESCYSESKITTTSSYTTGSILESFDIVIGGFIGRIVTCAEVENCASVSTFNTTITDAYKQYVGALVGQLSDSKILNTLAILTGENSVISTVDHTKEEYSKVIDICDVLYFGLVGTVSDTFETTTSKINNISYQEYGTSFATDSANINAIETPFEINTYLSETIVSLLSKYIAE